MGDAVDEFLKSAKHSDGTAVADAAAADDFLAGAKHVDGRPAAPAPQGGLSASATQTLAAAAKAAGQTPEQWVAEHRGPAEPYHAPEGLTPGGPGPGPGFVERMQQAVDPLTPGYWQEARARVQAKGGDTMSGVAEATRGAKGVLFGALTATPIGLGLQTLGAAAPDVVDPVMRNTFGLPGRGLAAATEAMGGGEQAQSVAQDVGDLATLAIAPRIMESAPGALREGRARIAARNAPDLVTPRVPTADFPAQVSRAGSEVPPVPAPVPVAAGRVPQVTVAPRALPEISSASRPGVILDVKPPVEGDPGWRPTRGKYMGLQARVADAGFKDLRSAVEAVQRGDENALQMLRPKDVEALHELASNVDPKYVGGPNATQFATPDAQPPSRLTQRSVGLANFRELPPGQDVPYVVPANKGVVPKTTVKYGAPESGVPQGPAPRDLGGYVERPTGRQFRQPGTVEPPSVEPPSAPPPAAPPSGAEPTPGDGVPPKAAIRAKPGLGAVIRAQTNQSIANLRSPESGGIGSDRLFFATKEIQSVRDRLSGARLRDFDQAWHQMTPKEQGSLTVAMMEDRAPTQTPAQARFRDWWNDPENQGNYALKLRDEATKSGIRVTDKDAPGGFREIGRIRRFLPQRMTPEALDLLKTDPAAQAEFYGEAAKQGLTKAEADDVLAHYREPGIRSYFAGQEAPRKFKIPDKWRPTDVGQTLRDYISRGARNEAEQVVLKNRDPVTGEARNVGRDGQMQGDLGDMLEDIRKEHGQGAADEAKDLFLEQVGRKPQSDVTHASKAVSNKIGAVNALRLYAGRLSTAVVQQTQHAMTAAHSGSAATARAIYRVGKNPLRIYDEAIRAGAVEPLSNWSDVTGIHEGGTPRGPLQRATNVGTAPMAVSDMAARLVAWETRADVAAKLQRQLRGNVWQRGVAKTMIEAMDYPPEAADAFARGLDQKGMDILGQRIVEKTQGKITDATRIPLAKGALGRIVMQGKNFGVEQTRNTWRVAGKQLFQAKNPVPAATLVAAAWLIGKGVNKTKDFLVGPQKSRDDSNLSALQQGGLGGMAGDVAYSLTQAKNMQAVVEQVKRLDETQFTAMVFDLAKLGAGEWSPPNGKDRWDVFLDAMHHAFPAESDWEKHYDRLFGGDSKLKAEIRANSRNDGIPRKGSEDYVRRLTEAVR